jgi:hypothetical protein
MTTAMIGEDLEADTDYGQTSVSLFDDSSLLDNSAEEMVEQNEVFFCRKM